MRILLALLLLWPLAGRAEPEAELEAFLTAPPAPLNLGITGDEAASKVGVIGPDGGKIRVTNAAGDDFLLTFPDGALLTDTRITATPVATSTGLPEGAGAISGLILEPDGLVLARTATLEITPKTPIPPESRLHWGFYEDGSDAFLHIPVQDTDSIIIPIDHFSGAGISFADRLNLQLDRWRQKSIEDRMSTQVSEIYRDIKKNGDPDGDKARAANDLLSGEATRRVFGGWRKMAASPAADCETLESGAKAASGLERQRQLLGMQANDDLVEVIRTLNARFWQVCFPEKVKECQQTGDLSALVRFVLGHDKMVQVLRLADEDSSEANHEPELRNALVACGRYKLTVVSSGKWKDSAGVYGTVDFKIEAPIRLTFSQPSGFEHYLEGEAGPTSQKLTFVDEACWKLDGSRAGMPFLGRLTDLTFNSRTSEPIKVLLKMRAVQLFAIISCTSKKRGKKTLDHEAVHITWGIGHQKQRNGSVYTIKDMKPGRYPKLFTYDWSGEGFADGTEASDRTTLTLEHIGG